MKTKGLLERFVRYCRLPQRLIAPPPLHPTLFKWSISFLGLLATLFFGASFFAVPPWPLGYKMGSIGATVFSAYHTINPKIHLKIHPSLRGLKWATLASSSIGTMNLAFFISWYSSANPYAAMWVLNAAGFYLHAVCYYLYYVQAKATQIASTTGGSSGLSGEE